MSSLLKSVLMLQKGIIPPQCGMPHAMNPNVLEILGDNSSVVIPTKSMEFKAADGKPKRILINNFDAAVRTSISLSSRTRCFLDKTITLTRYVFRVAIAVSLSKSISKIRLGSLD